jgi:hypothetical protein
MLRRVSVVRTDISAGGIASILRVTRIGELRTLAVTTKRRTLRRSISSTATQRNIIEDGILQSPP